MSREPYDLLDRQGEITRLKAEPELIRLWIPNEGMGLVCVPLMEYAPVGWSQLRWNVETGGGRTILTPSDPYSRSVEELATPGTLYVLQHAEEIGCLHDPRGNSSSNWPSPDGQRYDVWALVTPEMRAEAFALERLLYERVF